MNIFDKIEKAIGVDQATGSLPGWTTLEKANTFAALIIGLRPAVTIEIGVWCGRGAISMGLAHKEIGSGQVYAVDAWSAAASVEGQVVEADRNHWANQPEHDRAYQVFREKIQSEGLANIVHPIKSRSLDWKPIHMAQFVCLDGNHGEVAIADAERYGPHVSTGGILYLDDLSWSGGAVEKAHQKLLLSGFVDLYRFETGVFMQKL